MIAYLRGEILERSASAVILNVNGVGYLVHMTARSLDGLPDDGYRVDLHIQTHVREDDIALYGFTLREEKQCFNLLRSVSGVGPKLALSIISQISVDRLIQATELDDATILARVKGVGEKTARRIVVELKGKLSSIAVATFNQSVRENTVHSLARDAVSALLNLGYSSNDVDRVVKQLRQRNGDSYTSLEMFIRDALKVLQP